MKCWKISKEFGRRSSRQRRRQSPLTPTLSPRAGRGRRQAGPRSETLLNDQVGPTGADILRKAKKHIFSRHRSDCYYRNRVRGLLLLVRFSAKLQLRRIVSSAWHFENAVDVRAAARCSNSA